VFGFGIPTRQVGQVWVLEGLLAREASGAIIRFPTGGQ